MLVACLIVVCWLLFVVVLFGVCLLFCVDRCALLVACCLFGVGCLVLVVGRWSWVASCFGVGCLL